MSWTYSLVFTATAVGRRNQVRLNTGDTDTTRQLLQDEEIDHYLSAAGDVVVRGTIAALRAMLARFWSRPDIEIVGSVHINWGQLRAKWEALLGRYEADLSHSAVPWGGGISIDESEAFDDDTDVPRPAFTMDRGRYVAIPPATADTEE